MGKRIPLNEGWVFTDRFDEDFWRRRVRWALDYRKTVMGPDFPACRLIHGEADRFPGLTVDLFSDTLAVEQRTVYRRRSFIN